MKMLNAIIMILSMLVGCDSRSKNIESEPPPEPIPTIQYVMPSESAPHEGTWLQWPHEYNYGEIYRDDLEPTWIAMTRELVSGEKVHIIAYNNRAQMRIIEKLKATSISLDNIDFHLFETNDVWVRDNGPIYVRSKDSNTLTIEGWGFNGWGDKESYQQSAQIPQEIATATSLPFVKLDKKMILEGGSVELDGKGSLMATRSAILNTNRNPTMTQQEAETLFTTYLGATHFIWLDGVAGLEITDMHIDGFARFGEDNTIITMSEQDLQDWDLPKSDIDYLLSVKNPQSEPYEYITLPLTKNNVVTAYGENLGYRGSYVNYYIANGKVLVPTYSDPNDAVAISIIAKLYPTRTVVGIDVRNLYADGGMVHCVTQQQPQN